MYIIYTFSALRVTSRRAQRRGPTLLGLSQLQLHNLRLRGFTARFGTRAEELAEAAEHAVVLRLRPLRCLGVELFETAEWDEEVAVGGAGELVAEGTEEFAIETFAPGALVQPVAVNTIKCSP